MIRYVPKEHIAPLEKEEKKVNRGKNDVLDYLLAWIPNEPNGFLGKLIYGFALNSVFLPITFFTLVGSIGGLIVLAFGKSSDWGIVPKTIVAIGLPTLIISMILSTRIGNIVMGIWMLLHYLAFVFLVFYILTPVLINIFNQYSELF